AVPDISVLLSRPLSCLLPYLLSLLRRIYPSLVLPLFVFVNAPATPQIYTLSLHDALPICGRRRAPRASRRTPPAARPAGGVRRLDRKSTRLNSSHQIISYAVFCLKKKNARARRDNRTNTWVLR